MAESLKCSIAECKKRLAQVDGMSFSELEKYNVKCGNCGSWILKETQVANDTYNKVSNKWAVEFMNKLMKK